MLGPEIKTYPRNTIVFLVALVALIGFVGLAGSLWNTPGDREASFYALGAAVLCGFWLVWLNSVKLIIHSDGVSAETIFGHQEMRFDDVAAVTHFAVKQSVNLIPVGTYHTFKMVDANGKKIKFGNRYKGMSAVCGELIHLTTAVLYPKLAKKYNAGETLDFGKIKVSRAEGITVKSLFSSRTIPWNQLSSYKIEKGSFYIFTIGQKRDAGTALSEIPNAFVLQALLDAMCAPEPASVTAGV